MRRTVAVAAALLLAAGARPANAKGGAFTYPDLVEILGRPEAKSVEDLLALLPPAYRAHYALMFRSRSLQGGTFENPRALLFGEDARLVISFNGAPEQRGFEGLELMEFDDATAEFRYREISFAGGRAKISEPSPDKCRRCHGTPARPIWDTFPTWPGAYGERYRKGLSDPEAAGLERFKARQPDHPRYRALLNLDRLSPDDLLTSDVRRRLSYDGTVENPPNAQLGVLLSRMNFTAIAKDVTGSARFEPFAPALAAALVECRPVPDFIPAGMLKQFSKTLDQFAASVHAADAQEADLKERRTLAPQAGDEPKIGDANLELLYLAEEGLGLDVGRWTTALEKRTYDFTSLEGGLAELLPSIEAKATLVRQAAAAKAVPARYCERLKRASLAALAELPALERRAPAAPASTPAAQDLVQLCIGCHENSVAPDIPFSKPADLAHRLGREGYPRGTLLQEISYRLSPAAGADQMPRGRNLSDGERHQLMEYFSGLADAGK